MLNLSNIFQNINISHLIEDKTNLAVDLGVHALILFTILTCFFLLYITKITKSAINSHLGDLIEENSESIVKKSKELGGLQVQLLSKTLPFDHIKKAYDKPDKMQVNNNDWLQYSLIITNLSLLVMVAGSIMILAYTCNSDIHLGEILKLNLYTFILVGIIEYLFFTKVALKWIPSPPSLMITTIVNNIKKHFS